MPTMAEKVLARAAGRTEVRPGQTVTAVVDRIMAHEAFVLSAMKLMATGAGEVSFPDRIVVVLDHYAPAPHPKAAEIMSLARSLVQNLGIRNFLGSEGIGNQLMTEKALVRPGDLVIGTDSHTVTCGGVGAAGTGVGVTEAAYAMATGELWFRVPESIRIRLEGELAPGVMSKDVMLHIAGRHGTQFARYRSIEFAGPAAADLSVASRMTMANMGVELGAKFALFAADRTTGDYFQRRGVSGVPSFGPDPQADYLDTLTVDVSRVPPLVACPHSPGNVKPAADLGRLPVQQAFLGSCTNGRLEDLQAAARVLRGRRMHPDTRLLVTPASNRIVAQAARDGTLEILLAAGAQVTAPGCGACPGGHGGVLGHGERCISSTNRNFKGRMGSPDAEVYLGSPLTVAASALAGQIADPREFLEGGQS